MADNSELDAVEEAEVVTDMISGTMNRRDHKINAGPKKNL